VFQSSFEVKNPSEGQNALAVPSSNFGGSSTQLIVEAKRTILRNCLANFKKMRASSNEFPYSSKKILIIDDESFNCKALLGMISILRLPNMGKYVDVAYSGEEAIELVKNNIR